LNGTGNSLFAGSSEGTESVDGTESRGLKKFHIGKDAHRTAQAMTPSHGKLFASDGGFEKEKKIHFLRARCM
jgi:hypothetical protein